jgi:hypothetical protein
VPTMAEAARARGARFGRKPKLDAHQQDEVLKRPLKGESARALGRSYKVHHATFPDFETGSDLPGTASRPSGDRDRFSPAPGVRRGTRLTPRCCQVASEVPENPSPSLYNSAPGPIICLWTWVREIADRIFPKRLQRAICRTACLASVGAKVRAVSNFLFGLATALAVSVIPVSATDLGGSCCADREERIAELETLAATTGNRKVSLQKFGFVGRIILNWNDGFQSNTYYGLGLQAPVPGLQAERPRSCPHMVSI